MEYHKINGLYKRWRKDLHDESELPIDTNFDDFIIGDFAQAEFEYLFNNQWIWSEKLDGTNIRIYANWSEQYGIHTFEVKGRHENSSIPKDLLEWIKNWIGENAQPCTVAPATMNWPPATWCSVRSSSGAVSKCQRPWLKTRSSAHAASTWPMNRS